MVEQQVRNRGIDQPELLDAMREVPRHRFLPERRQKEAYEATPLSLERDQTFHEAYLSALMISLLDLEPKDTVLEIGTGTGYDAAVLSRVAGRVYTIEIDPALGRLAKGNLDKLGYGNVRVRVGDGYQGWPEEAPFDGIVLTVASETIPQPLIDQLAVGGRLVAAVGGGFFQQLQVITKTDATTLETRTVSAVRVGAMEGEARQQR